jgi:FMN phosphatase YigB (HAD superfamily)
VQHTTLISDFDNTLYDWFQMWDRSFNAMLTEIRRVSGLGEDILIPQIREIHQRHGTSEYSYLIEEMPALKAAFPDQDLTIVFDEAIHLHRRARKESLALYPGVIETLTWLRSQGVLIVLYTDSLAYYTNFRVRRLGLDALVDFVFSPPDHDLPAG